MTPAINEQMLDAQTEMPLELKPQLKQLREVAKLPEAEIARSPDQYQDQVDLYQDYLSRNRGSLPRGLIIAYNNELKTAISRLQSVQAASQNEGGWCLEHQRGPSYSAIVCLYKRSSIDDVLKSLLCQTVPPKSIMILINGNHIIPDEVRRRYPEALVTQSDINSLYTRWCVGYILEGDYIFVCDDDQVPGSRYLERALRLSAEKRALVCGTGRRYNKDGKRGFYEVLSPYHEANNIDNRLHSMPAECDWGCNSYLFRKDWIHFILAEKRYKDYQLKTDDIQLASNLYAYGGISCWVTQQDPDDINSLHSAKSELGDDQHALWKKGDHFPTRKEYLEYLVDNGLYTPFYCRMKADE